ncbi:acyl-CoA dehydrogenase [Desertibaculum subflavum]|uniref:acyl-CoA dehydrogenase n=1 Tax=Desertibaculum subflavum TaxID=2268458 RepID=UPI000E66B474
MADYRAPLKEIRFTLEHVADLGGLAKLPGCESAEPDLVAAVLEEAGKFAEGVLAPTNKAGDHEGARFENGVVRTAPGFAAAYKQFSEGGWNGVPFDPDFGGGGLPWAISIAVQEMMTSANMAFCLCPLLTQGAVEMISHHGTAEQKATYLANMVTGKWTGTMNLTEPQAGSDVGALRSKAEPNGDGSYRITGQKIFITYGEHDMAENIVHLVLARLPGAPGGTRGISCFIVPKFLVNADGSLGAHNDLRCVSIEEKLGIHGSPTCVMSFGDQGGATGWLIGEENKGMRSMFTMMNNARLSVGLQGLAIAERSYQQAVAFARERRQGSPPRGGANATIVEHPDVRRMLLLMRSQIEAMRGLIYLNAESIDRAHHHPDEAERAKAQALVELLTPVSKGWSTDLGVELTSIGVQVHGGMGFIEETGAAQHFRDSRIAPIYEGTNGIQALDLVMRKLPLEGGQTVRRFIGEMKALDEQLGEAKGPAFAALRGNLETAIAALEMATDWLAEASAGDPAAAAAGATPYLRMFGITAGGYLIAKGALAAAKLKAEGHDPAFHDAKIATARFYAEQVLPQAAALGGPVMAGTEAIYAIPAELLSA